jgi:RNA polymerase sigma factor (sigma-70 family)
LVAAGDRAAIRQCIARHGPIAWAIARRFAVSDQEARAAVVDIFDELSRRAGDYDPDAISEPAFITMIARRWMIETLWREQRPTLKPDALSEGEAVMGIERCVEASIAAGVLASLDPHQRQILSLAIGQGMTHAEVAEATAAPVEVVKSLVRRALVAVRKRLQAGGRSSMSAPQKRLHTLLTDRAVAGLAVREHAELELLLAGAAVDLSYERAAAALELGLRGHAEPLPAELEAALVEGAERRFGPERASELEAEATPVRRTWERSPDGLSDFDFEAGVLESSLTNGRIERVPGPGDSLAELLVPAADLDDAAADEHAEQYQLEIDAQLEALEQAPATPAVPAEPSELSGPTEPTGPTEQGAAAEPEPEPEPELRDPGASDSGFGMLDDDDDDDDDDLDDEVVEQPAAKPAPSVPASPVRDYRLARWASYVSAIVALALFVVAMTLFVRRDNDRAPEPEDVRAALEGADDTREWSFTPEPAYADASGSVLWSDTLQAGVLSLRGLAANDPAAAQYQLWIVDLTREGPAVDGGVFDVPVGVEKFELLVDAKLLIGEPEAFLITRERPGGVVVSDHEQVVMVAEQGL